MIQIDEPAIIKYPEDWQIFEKAVANLIAARDKSAAEGNRPELALYVYFHDPAPLYEKLIGVEAAGQSLEDVSKPLQSR